MKKVFTSIVLTLITLVSFGQSVPQAISWQTVVRNLDGSLVQNQFVSVRFDLHQGSANGTVVFSETHADTTDEFGLLNLALGAGTPVSGQFDTIDWGNGPYFTEVLVDPSGGANYLSTGAQQMMSVPYALYAGSAANLPMNGEEGQTLNWCNGAPYWGPCPTCDDGIQNGDETGVDCGGACPSECDISYCITLGEQGRGTIGQSIIEMSDSGYCVVGYTTITGAGSVDMFVARLNSTGELQWANLVGGSSVDRARSVVETSDGGLAIAGYTDSYGAGNSDVYIVKLSSSGSLLWTRTLGDTSTDYGEAIIETSDGGLAVAGYTQSYGAGNWDMYIIKLSSSGSLQWTRTVGGVGNDKAFCLVETRDGGLAIAGETNSFGMGIYDMYIVRLNSSGDLLWTRTIGTYSDEDAHSIIETNDGSLVVAGSTNNGLGAGDYDMYIVKLDSTGVSQWTRMLGGNSHDLAYSLVATNEGGIAVAGKTSSFGAGGSDVYIAELNTNGTLQWSLTTGSINYDEAYSLIQTSDGGFSAIGESEGHLYIIKLQEDGTVCCASGSGGTVNSGGSSASGGSTGNGGLTGIGGIVNIGGTKTVICE